MKVDDKVRIRRLKDLRCEYDSDDFSYFSYNEPYMDRYCGGCGIITEIDDTLTTPYKVMFANERKYWYSASECGGD